jgi:endonuclease/exonuclease/phosphatase family metal-dependent hydrolase
MIKLFRWLNLLLVLVTLLCYLSPYVPPARFSWLGILGTGYPILVICHVFFLLFWAWQWKNYWWYSALALLTGVMYLGHFFGIQTSPVLSADNIRIATYNIGSFYNLNTGKRPDTAGFNRLIWATDADVLCLQEVALKTSVLDRHLKKYRSLTAYPYRFWQKGTSAVIFSKFPIVNQGQIKLDTYVNGCIFVDLNVHGRKIRVYTIHLQSNKITVATNDLASEGDLSEKETWSKAKHIVDRVRNVAGVRAKQAAIIKAHQEQSPHPAVICGDFNETPLSYTYRQLSAGMQDAFYSAGSGLGFTYSGKYPFLALDYILADRTFNIYYSKVVRSSYSDHYLVVSDIKWNK